MRASQPPPTPACAALLERLRQTLPAETLLTAPEELRPYECDGLTTQTQLPQLVLLPNAVDQVRTIMTHCHECQVPVVVRGAGTSLVGGAQPVAGGVVLSLARLNRIIEIDPDNRYARVQPGVRNHAINRAAQEFDLFYAPDPTSLVACTIGGNIAANAGGVHAMKYGNTAAHLLEAKLVTAEGELVTLGHLANDLLGYDLLSLLAGSEGLLGVVIEATVQLLPRPASKALVLANFASLEASGQAAAQLLTTGISLAALEILDEQVIDSLADSPASAYLSRPAAILIGEIDGSAAEVERLGAQVRQVLNQAGAARLQTLTDRHAIDTVWSGRRAAFVALGKLAPNQAFLDGTVPPPQLAKVMRRIQELAASQQLPLAMLSHAGAGILYPIVLYDANQPAQTAAVAWLQARVMELYLTVGGSIASECGIGTHKLVPMCQQFRIPELTQLHRIKTALDRDSLLNPGKGVPDPQHCAELGSSLTLPTPH